MKSHCQHYQGHFSLYLDEELPQAIKQELEAHLEHCPVCQKELELFKATVLAVRNLPTPPPPEDFLIKLRRRIEAQVESQPVSFWSRITTQLVAHPSLLAGIMLGLFVGAFILGRFSPELNFQPISLELEPALAWKSSPVRYNHREFSSFRASRPGEFFPVMAVSYSALGTPEKEVKREEFSLQTPTQLVITLIHQDPDFKSAEIYPIPQGAVVITRDQVLRITISGANFLKALKIIAQTGSLPRSFSEAKKIFSLQVEELPNPLNPLP